MCINVATVPLAPSLLDHISTRDIVHRYANRGISLAFYEEAAAGTDLDHCSNSLTHSLALKYFLSVSVCLPACLPACLSVSRKLTHIYINMHMHTLCAAQKPHLINLDSDPFRSKRFMFFVNRPVTKSVVSCRPPLCACFRCFGFGLSQRGCSGRLLRHSRPCV